MRLSQPEIQAIRDVTRELVGEDADVRLFGSRTDDSSFGGDVDLLIECRDDIARPAWLAALISARLSRYMEGRRVDVILSAPNLKDLEIHAVARKCGVLL